MSLVINKSEKQDDAAAPPPQTLRGHLLNQSPEFIFKVLVIGSSGVGKTTFLRRLTGVANDPAVQPTVGIDYFVHSCRPSADGQPVRLQLWDTAGQERFRSLSQAFYRGAIGFIVMFDRTSAASFLDLQYWLEQIKLHAWSSRSVVMIVGNKSDCAASVDSRHAEEFALHNQLAYAETSAQDGQNVEESIALLVGRMVESVERLGLEWHGSMTTTTNEQHEKSEKKGCCS